MKPAIISNYLIWIDNLIKENPNPPRIITEFRKRLARVDSIRELHDLLNSLPRAITYVPSPLEQKFYVKMDELRKAYDLIAAKNILHNLTAHDEKAFIHTLNSLLNTQDCLHCDQVPPLLIKLHNPELRHILNLAFSLEKVKLPEKPREGDFAAKIRCNDEEFNECIQILYNISAATPKDKQPPDILVQANDLMQTLLLAYIKVIPEPAALLSSSSDLIDISDSMEEVESDEDQQINTSCCLIS